MAGANLGVATCSALVNPTVETAFPDSTGSVRAVLTLKNGIIANRYLRWRLVAIVSTSFAPSVSFTLKIRKNSGSNTNLTTFTNDTQVMTTGALTITLSQPTALLFHGYFFWSPDISGNLSNFGGRLLTANSHTATPTLTLSGYTQGSGGVTATTVDKVMFLATGIFGTSDASNLATVTEFAIDQD